MARMAASTGPSEFGGKTMKNGVQPSPHVPTVNERLMLLYTTGDDSGRSNRDNGETFSGLLPADVQLKLRQAEGVMTKGEAWDVLVEAGKTEGEALKNEEGIPLA